MSPSPKEHPVVRKARLEAEKAAREAEKSRDEFFKVLKKWELYTKLP